MFVPSIRKTMLLDRITHRVSLAGYICSHRSRVAVPTRVFLCYGNG